MMFYDGSVEVIDQLGAFVNEGLALGHTCLVVATEDHLASLGELVTPEMVSSSRGRFVTQNAATALGQFVSAGKLDRDRFDETVGKLVRECAAVDAPVRVYGEMVALLWAEGEVAAALKLEDLWNALLADVDFELLCAYPRTDVDGSPSFTEICNRHTVVLPGEKVMA